MASAGNKPKHRTHQVGEYEIKITPLKETTTNILIGYIKFSLIGQAKKLEKAQMSRGIYENEIYKLIKPLEKSIVSSLFRQEPLIIVDVPGVIFGAAKRFNGIIEVYFYFKDKFKFVAKESRKEFEVTENILMDIAVLIDDNLPRIKEMVKKAEDRPVMARKKREEIEEDQWNLENFEEIKDV